MALSSGGSKTFQRPLIIRVEVVGIDQAELIELA